MQLCKVSIRSQPSAGTGMIPIESAEKRSATKYSHGRFCLASKSTTLDNLISLITSAKVTYFHAGEADRRFERMLKAYHDDHQYPGDNRSNLPRVTLHNPSKSSQTLIQNNEGPIKPSTYFKHEPNIEYRHLPEVKKNPKITHNQATQANRIKEFDDSERKKIRKPKVVAEPIHIDLPVEKKQMVTSKMLDMDEESPINLHDISVSSTETVFGKDGARRKLKRNKPPIEPAQIEGEVSHTYTKSHKRMNSHAAEPETLTQNPNQINIATKGLSDKILKPNSHSTAEKSSKILNPPEHLKINTAQVEFNPRNPPETPLAKESMQNPSNTAPDQPKYIKVKLPNEQHVYLTRNEHLAFHLALREAAKHKGKQARDGMKEAGVETDIRGDDILDFPDSNTHQNEEAELNQQTKRPPSAAQTKRETPTIELKPHKTHRSLGTDGLFESGPKPARPRNLEYLPNVQRLPDIPKTTKPYAPAMTSVKDKFSHGVPPVAGDVIGTDSNVRISKHEPQRTPAKNLSPIPKPNDAPPKPESSATNSGIPLHKSVLPALTMMGTTQASPSPQPKVETAKPQTKSFGSDFNSVTPHNKPRQSTFGGQTDKVRSISIETQHKPEETKKLDLATATDPIVRVQPPVLKLTHQSPIIVTGKSPIHKKYKDQGVDTKAPHNQVPQVTLCRIHSEQRAPPKGLAHMEPHLLERKPNKEMATATEAGTELANKGIEREEHPTMFAEEPAGDDLSRYGPDEPDNQHNIAEDRHLDLYAN
jgi:hypothetical protein